MLEINRHVAYIEYRLFMLKQHTLNVFHSFGTLSTIWSVLVGFTVASVVIYYVERTDYYLIFAAAMFIPVIFLTLYFDYRKGYHVHWYRQRRDERYKKQREGI